MHHTDEEKAMKRKASKKMAMRKHTPQRAPEPLWSVKFIQVDWDKDGKRVKLPRSFYSAISIADLDVPAESVTEESVRQFIREYGADICSDRFGFLVNSFGFEIGTPPQVRLPRGCFLDDKLMDAWGFELDRQEEHPKDNPRLWPFRTPLDKWRLYWLLDIGNANWEYVRRSWSYRPGRRKTKSGEARKQKKHS